ncbi:uncharacterized protein [Amphiura filiformis]|uniref:uncharacterized protein n=1 Tax=Amphiura filiformis TaxID=82378 RepID=UPI003B20F75F
MASSPGPGLTLIKGKDIKLGKKLGQGGFGAVYIAKHVNWGDVAVKRLKGVTLTADVQREADRMLRVVSSPYLVRIMGLIKNPGDIGIVMEFFENGSLKEFETKYMKCDCLARKVKMVRDIAFGMNYLHTLNPPIIHRDLKLENVFVDNAFDAKIGDLGLAVSSMTSRRYAHVSGTRSHIPPEASTPKAIIEPDEFWDIYTFAITTFELVSGKDAWPQQQQFANDALIALWVIQGHRPDLEAIPSEVPSELVDIIKKCWVGEPKQRPSFKDILNSVTELFEAEYKQGLRKADRAIFDQMDLQDRDDARAQQSGSSTTDSGVDFWGSFEGKDRNSTKVATATKSANKKWQYKHTIDPADTIIACHTISQNHLAVCIGGYVKVYTVSADTSHLAYTLTAEEWRQGRGKYTTGAAVSESLADSVLVICGNIPYVYQYPLHESAKEIKTYQINVEKYNPGCIVANASVAVLTMPRVNSFITCKLPQFTQQSRATMSFEPCDLSITSDYLLLVGREVMVVRALSDVMRDVCRVQSPDGWEFRSGCFNNDAREIYAGCSQGYTKGCVYRYTWNRAGKPVYINSGCIIDGLGNVDSRHLSVTSDGLLAVGQYSVVKIYKFQ